MRSSRKTRLLETKVWNTLGIFLRATRRPSRGSVTALQHKKQNTRGLMQRPQHNQHCICNKFIKILSNSFMCNRSKNFDNIKFSTPTKILWTTFTLLQRSSYVTMTFISDVCETDYYIMTPILASPKPVSHTALSVGIKMSDVIAKTSMTSQPKHQWRHSPTQSSNWPDS